MKNARKKVRDFSKYIENTNPVEVVDTIEFKHSEYIHTVDAAASQYMQLYHCRCSCIDSDAAYCFHNKNSLITVKHMLKIDFSLAYDKQVI